MAKAVRYEDIYPTASEELLKSLFLEKDIRDIEGPAAIVDRAAVKRNCHVMLESARKLELGFRAHVKTHKTTQVTRMQVGDNLPDDARIVVSTIAEAEQQLPLLAEYHKRGRKVNLLYGIPPSAKAYARLKSMRNILGPDGVSFLIDHPVQLHNFIIDAKKTEEPVPVFVKIDVGQHRAGLEPASKSLQTLLEAISHSQQSKGPPHIKLAGFYSHNSGSYGSSSPEDALRYLAEELYEVGQGAQKARELDIVKDRLTISIGATPTTVAVQNLVKQSDEAKKVQELLESLTEDFDVEIHAGNYPFLDMQQLVTHARPLVSDWGPSMTSNDIAFRVLAEVLSVYSEREVPEALIGAGCLALGREPCKAYPGWGIVAQSPWPTQGDELVWDEVDETGWIVGRISQEHGVLTWSGSPEKTRQLKIGEKITLFPNHSCISAAGFGWLLVVDSSLEEGQRTKIVDVWLRSRGW